MGEHKAHQTAILDTNIFLHFKLFTDIPWTAVLDADKVTLVILPIVLRELDAKKDNASSRDVRHRAAKVLKKFEELVELGRQKAELNDDVLLYFEGEDPIDELRERRWSDTRQDNFILAGADKWKAEHPDEDLVLVAADSSLRLRARTFDICEAIDLDSRYKLAQAEDPLEKENRELKQQLQRLENAQPKLKVTFENDSSYMKIRPSYLKKLTKSEEEDYMDQIRENCRFIGTSIPEILSSALYSDKDIKNYNGKVKLYYDDSLRYYRELVTYQSVKNAAELHLYLRNDGSKPGEDIDIRLTFPDGCRVFTEKDLPDEPVKPFPPARPSIVVSEVEIAQSLFPAGIFNEPQTVYATLPNVSCTGVDYRESFCYVDIHIGKAKHNMLEELPSLYLLFDEQASVQSFQLHYRINAGNVSDPIEGILHIRVEDDENV